MEHREAEQHRIANAEQLAHGELVDGGNVTAGSFFASGEAINWTSADLARLMSIDELHTRLLEYHNNVHARTIYGIDVFNNEQGKYRWKDPKDKSSPPIPKTNDKDIVVLVKHFGIDSADYQPQWLHFDAMNTWLDKKKLDKHQIDKNTPLTWVHVKDPAVIGALAMRFGIHELCVAAFSDLRAFSSFIPVPGAVFLSFCTFQLDKTKANMFKVFTYVSGNIVITFEREIMPDLLDADGPVQDNVCTELMARHEQLEKNCRKLGGVYLMYSLALQSLSLQDPIIDFFSRTLYYFKQKVTTRQFHKDKLMIARQMHAVAMAVTMVKNSIMHAEDTFVRLLSGAMTGTFTADDPDAEEAEKKEGDAAGSGAEAKKAGISVVQLSGVQGKVSVTPRLPLLSPNGLLISDHTPYLLDIVDSYKFMNHLLQTELEEVQALTSAMDALTTLRSINTSTLLSLVATIFMPLNFVCGIFGTNFVYPASAAAEAGDYYMTILNNPEGPKYFLIICVASVFVIFIYFWYNGWVDLRIRWSRLFHWMTCYIFTGQRRVAKPTILTERDVSKSRNN